MTFVNGHLPRIESLLVLALLLPLFEDQDGFNIAISSSIVKKSVHARIDFVQLAAVLNQLDETVVVAIPYGNHSWSPFVLVHRGIRQHFFF